jgi:hypothetical protein
MGVLVAQRPTHLRPAVTGNMPITAYVSAETDAQLVYIEIEKQLATS